MHQSCAQRSIRSPMGVPRVGVLAATITVAFLANTATWTAALAQQVGPITQYEAPITYRQKLVEQDALDKKEDKEIENDICSACALDPNLDSSICHGCPGIASRASD
jgi:hypothetical protein